MVSRMRLLSHFVPLFVSGNAPRIVVEDAENVDIETVFSESIVQQKTDKVTIEIDGEDREIEVIHACALLAPMAAVQP
jgi:hypothetical protein